MEHGGTESRIGLQHDLVAAFPLLHQERPRAHGVVADLPGRRIRFGHFARHHGGGRHGQVKQEIRVDGVQADAQGVFVQRLQAGDRRVVAEFGFQGRIAHQLIFQQEQPRRLQAGVIQPRQAVHIILRRHFARLALEGGIGGEEDTRLQVKDIRAPAIFHGGHGTRRIALQLYRTGQVVITQERIEDVFHQVQAGQVGGHGRVQARLAGAQEQVQGLVRAGIGGGMAGRGK